MNDLIEQHEPLQDCDCHTCSIHARNNLRKAMIDILKELPRYECSDLHHSKKDRHEGYECPVVERLNNAIDRAKQLLPNPTHTTQTD